MLRFLLALCFCTPLVGLEVVVKGPEGHLELVEFVDEVPLEQAFSFLTAHFATQDPVVLDLSFAKEEKRPEVAPFQGHKEVERSFTKEVSKQEKKDIALIVNTLGMGSLLKIAGTSGQLKAAGTRVESIHPLKFLQVIFQDEEMKVSLQAMKKRGWVWTEFFEGLKVSLDEESERNNLQETFVQEFASTLHLDAQKLFPFIQQRNWQGFVDTLIKLLPRSTKADRYDV